VVVQRRRRRHDLPRNETRPRQVIRPCRIGFIRDPSLVYHPLVEADDDGQCAGAASDGDKKSGAVRPLVCEVVLRGCACFRGEATIQTEAVRIS
jgi:hypothetical protein